MSFVQVRCPHCDSLNDIDSKACSQCGKGMKAAVTRGPAIAPATAQGAVRWGTITLCILSVLAGIIGLLSLSEATQGVGFIAFACLLAIWSRMAQAGDHRRA